MQDDRVAEYREAAEDALNRAKDLLERDDWNLKKEEQTGVVMSDVTVEGEPIRCMKVMGFIPNVDAKELALAMWNFAEPEWKKMENTVKSFEVVEYLDGIGSKAKVCYQVNSLPWPMSDRDTVALWTMFEENDKYYFVSTSVIHASKPETSKFVRNTLVLGLYLIEPAENGTEVTRLIHINPNGNLPTAVVNKGNERVYDMIKNLAEIAVGYKDGIRRSKKNIRESKHN